MVRSVSPSMFFHGTPMAQTAARKTSESLIMVHVRFTIRTCADSRSSCYSGRREVRHTPVMPKLFIKDTRASI